MWSNALIGAAVAVPAGWMLLRAYDAMYLRVRHWQTHAVKLNAMKQRAAIQSLRHLPPDENARAGWVIRPDGSITNLDSYATLNADGGVRHLDATTERLDRIERLLLAGLSNGTEAQSILELPEAAFHWPNRYDFDAMIKQHIRRVSHHNVLLGVSYDERGIESPVIADMEDLIHVMIGGRSGFGKSNLEYVIARQLIESADQCRLALIDYAGVTLKPLEQSGRVLWPTATDDETAIPVLRGVVQELERRKQLYTDCPGVQKLSQYNALPDREPLEPWYLFLDETSQALRNSKLAEMLTIISEQARKFGLGIIGAGTTWHAKYAPEPFRVNFATRMAVYCARSTSRVVLDGDPGASELERPGQACAMLPGRTGVHRMLTPEVEFKVIEGDGPMRDPPKTEDDLRRRVVDAWYGLESPSVTAVTEQLFDGQRGGSHWDDVKEIVYSEGLE